MRKILGYEFSRNSGCPVIVRKTTDDAGGRIPEGRIVAMVSACPGYGPHIYRVSLPPRVGVWMRSFYINTRPIRRRWEMPRR